VLIFAVLYLHEYISIVNVMILNVTCLLFAIYIDHMLYFNSINRRLTLMFISR